jgi:hypothetical protein
MAELKRIDEEFRAAELATYGIPPKQLEGPKLVKGQEAETLDKGAAVSKLMALFRKRRWEISDRSGASYRPDSWTSHAGLSKAQTSW